MYHPLALFIGRRYAGTRRSDHFISFISTTSMIGLMLGVLVLITVMSVMNGFDRELRERVLGMVPHAVLRPAAPLTDWQSVTALVQQDPQVRAAAPFVHAQGMATAGGQVQGVFLNGIDPQVEPSVSIVQNHLQEGRLDALREGEFGIILGDILARLLRADIGDRITLVLPEASVTPAGVYPRLKRFTVVGTFSVGAELDASLALVHIADAARLKRMPGQVEGIRLAFHDLFQARSGSWAILDRLEQQTQQTWFASDWTRTHGNLFQAIRMEKTLVGLLLMLIVAVAAFNIVSSLVMVVTEKKADIAILRTMGATRGQILRIFMVQGALIGVLGTLLGTVLGVLLASNISTLIAAVENLLDFKFLSPDVYFISYLPSQVQWQDVAVISTTTLALSLLATIYPAIKASRVEPAEALRHE